jgi:hypothetical protein
VASLNGRVSKLEGRIPPPADKGEEARREIMHAVLDEIGRLSACRANGHYRGGTPPTPIQPTDPVGDALGYPYTQAEFVEFAIRRVVGRLDLSAEGAERIVTSWVATLRSVSGERRDEVAAEGPPEPTPPWGSRSGSR